MTKHMIPLTALILMIIFLGAILKPGVAATLPQPQFQETAYPIETEYPVTQPTGYAGPETPITQPTSGNQGNATPSAAPSATNTLQPGQPTFTPAATQTAAPSSTQGPTPTPHTSPTKGRDLFATEDAEIKNARVTPPASETPAPSHTVRPSPSPTRSNSPSPAASLAFDSSWFLAGLLPAILILLAFGIYYRLKNSGEFHR